MAKKREKGKKALLALRQRLTSFQERWGFNNLDLAIVFLVFSLAGMSSLALRNTLQALLPTPNETSLAPLISGLTFFLCYYLMLVSIGVLLGKARFFLWMALRPFRRIKGLFVAIKKMFRSLIRALTIIVFQGKL